MISDCAGAVGHVPHIYQSAFLLYTHHSHQIYHGMIGGFLMSCFRAKPFLLYVIFAVGKNDLSQKSIEIKKSLSDQKNSKKILTMQRKIS
jgi:hypothetical protein